MSTIRHVADDAGVSIATVSRVLNQQGGVRDEIRERVLTSARRCGYTKGGTRAGTTPIALAFTGPASISSPYDTAVLEGIWDALDDTDLDLQIMNLGRDKRPDESYEQLFYRKGIRGVVLRTTTRTRETCRFIAHEGFPAIVLGDRFEDDSKVSWVYGDSRPSSRQAMDHLFDLGHRNIAVAVSMVEDQDHHDRIRAYRESLAAHGVEFDERWLLRIPASLPDGAQVVRTTMSMADRPTAIYVTDPIVAIGVLNEAQRIGVRVPEELSVVGFDDAQQRRHVFPAMTAVCQDARQLGFEAIQGLTQLMQNEREPVRRTCRTWFEIHETTSCPPASASRVLHDGTRLADPGNPGRSTKETRG